MLNTLDKLGGVPSESLVHLFAQGTWDFLVGAAALSILIALVVTVVDDVVRPQMQKIIVKAWLKPIQQSLRAPQVETPKPATGDAVGAVGDVDPEVSKVIDPIDSYFAERGRLPESAFHLPPDQLCAQISRRMNGALDYLAPGWPFKDTVAAAPIPAPADTSVRAAEYLEDEVDDLQSKLTRDASSRSYYTSFATALVFGCVLYSWENPHLRAPDAGMMQWLVLTACVGFTASLLAPLFQSLIVRILKAR